jgi:membrane protein YqaA with SNARE-associated domain
MDGVIVGAFLACVVGGLLPWLNTEIVVTGAALLLTPPEIALLVSLATVGNMLAKTGVYGLARWAPHRLPEKARKFLSKPDRLGKGGWAVSLTLLASSTAGLPPFYLTTLAAGALRVPLVIYGTMGFAGTAIRYGVLATGAALASAGLGVAP